MSEGVQSERRLMKRRRMRPGIVRRRVTAAASVIGTKTVPIPIAISMMLGRTWPTYDDETSSNECTGRNLRHQTADDLRDHDDRRADPQEREACLDRGQPHHLLHVLREEEEHREHRRTDDQHHGIGTDASAVVEEPHSA